MSEELYLQWEMKYRDSWEKVAEEVRKEERYKMARGLLMDGISVDVLERVTKIPHEELLRMKADVDGKTV